jgi:hypothetical protein
VRIETEKEFDTFINNWFKDIKFLSAIDWLKVRDLKHCLAIFHALISVSFKSLTLPGIIPSVFANDPEKLSVVRLKVKRNARKVIIMMPDIQVKLDNKIRALLPSESLIIRPIQ